METGKEIISGNHLRRIYDEFAAAVAYISVIDKNGNEAIGTCFHIGDGVFITARHVVEGCQIKEIGTTVSQRKYFETEETTKTGGALVEYPFWAKSTPNFKGPFFHPDIKIDVAALIVSEIDAPIIPLGDHLDDWLGDELVLTEAIVFGYPPIPFSRQPLLIVTKCEVNAIVDKYTGGHPHFILSSIARGGFSGGPALSEHGFALDVITESLLKEGQPADYLFIPGQATDISINKAAWKDELRPFTFTCLPNDDHIEFTIKTYPERMGVTNELLNIKNGDELILHDVFGVISYRGEGLFIAGGAGITPFIAILRQLASKNEIGDNKLIFANKSKADIIYEAEFKILLGNNFINVLSDEKIEGYEQGHITEALLAEHLSASRKYIYLCGPPLMMAASEKQLANLKIPSGYIIKEGF